MASSRSLRVRNPRLFPIRGRPLALDASAARGFARCLRRGIAPGDMSRGPRILRRCGGFAWGVSQSCTSRTDSRTTGVGLRQRRNRAGFARVGYRAGGLYAGASALLGHGTRSAANYGGSNGHWNHEHCWPRSYGIGSSGPGNADLFNLRPCDVQGQCRKGELSFCRNLRRGCGNLCFALCEGGAAMDAACR